jgi:hypothetical protein
MMTTSQPLRKLKHLSLALVTGLGLTAAGCSTNAGTGALIGGASGAGIGAIIGHNSHDRTAEGALIGGAVGAIGGGLIGNEIDKSQARERYSDQRYYGDRRSYYDAPPAPGYYDRHDPYYDR